ncbi:MAG: galactokinase [Candidatus Hydrogenedentes bacterium]|nr:galactokinase [Candidatus Hydrogenedentota bacterium]
MSIDRKQAVSKFEGHFGEPPTLAVRAPGRVNIIGEHTDYNHGFVLPMAIERETAILARPIDEGVIRAFAANLDRTAEAPLDRFERNADEPWMDYVVGVARELDGLAKPLRGAEIMIIGDVPVGCGLSSSASLEMAALCLFETLGGFTIEGPEAARLGRRVENEFLGLNTGVMDQFISRFGKAGHVLFLDCRSFDYELVPVSFKDACFVIANTGVSRGLTASKYNERVTQCREAVECMRKKLGKKDTHLRDFRLEDLETSKESLSDVVYRRARHVITENARTEAACEAMRAGDAAELGRLMNASDESLRADYEVTCVELDTMTAIARDLDGCFGSRMTGAGFGGCTVSLVEASRAVQFADDLGRAYTAQTGLRGDIMISVPADGAGEFRL